MNGYVLSETYDAKFFNKMSPLNFRTKCILSGYRPPKIQTACELGFGFGNSINIFAATTDIEWWGTDFNQSQAYFAQNLSHNVQNGAKLFADSFEKFLSRDLPQFDYITLHGIYSWVDADIRRQILDIIDKHLAPGGGLYISYNAKPGQNNLQSLRDFLKVQQKYVTPHSKLPTESAVESFEVLEHLNQIGARFVKNNEALQGFINEFKDNPHYVVHEFLNSAWDSFSVLDIAEDLRDSQLSFLSRADVNPYLDEIIFPSEQFQFINDASNPLLKEFYKDHITNSGFRSDFWIRGGIKMTPIEQYYYLLDLTIISVERPENLSFRTKIWGQSIDLNQEIYEPIFNYLKDQKPKAVKDLVAECNIQQEHLLAILSTLLQVNYIKLYEEPSELAQARADRMNDYLLNNINNSKLDFLVSSLSQDGILSNSLTRLFIYFMKQGIVDVDGLAEAVKNWLDNKGQNITSEGKVLSGQEAIDHLIVLAKEQVESIDLLKLHNIL